MKLGDQRASGNVEDRRGIGMVGGGIGIGGIVIAVVAYFLGFDPGAVLSVVEQVAPQAEMREAPKGAPADEMGQFVAKVLGSTEVVWGKTFDMNNPDQPGYTRAWLNEEGGCLAARAVYADNTVTLFQLSSLGAVEWQKKWLLPNSVRDSFTRTTDRRCWPKWMR